MLIIFGGLPGTGKTTISKEIAKRLKAVYLRVDTVEQTLKSLKSTSGSIGPEGYMICYQIAIENLQLGLNVVADSVNSIAVTRNDWRSVAEKANSKLIEIELICTDKQKHQHRIENREADLTGHRLPTWQDVLKRDYEPWERKTLTIDTSTYSIAESVKFIIEYITQNDGN